MQARSKKGYPAKSGRNVTARLPAGLHPDRAAHILTQGQTLLKAGRAQEVVLLLIKAHTDYPGDVRILTLNAQALMALGRNELAIGVLFIAIDLQPENANIHFALGILLRDQGNLELAAMHSMESFRFAPNHVHATELSNVLIALGRYEDALAAATHALSLKPGHWEALVIHAIALQGLGRFEEAVIAGQQTIAISPGNIVAHFNLGHSLLSLGRMTTEAWSLYEWRLRLDGNPAWLLDTADLRWKGKDISNQTILLQAEQGFGDTLQFVRYAPLVAKLAGRVILAVQPALARLLHSVAGVDQVVAIGGELPHFDVVCPLLSLPLIFETTLYTIPPPLPYAGAFERPNDRDKGILHVGLVWAGSQTNKNDRQRSLKVADWASLVGIPGVQLYSLQQHDPGREELPPNLGVIDLMAGVKDFRDTADLVAGLDLVIAVDTAVAHLAATMGKPVWLLSSWRGCWRWMHDRLDSPWYPSVRIFRQPQSNNWTSVLEQVRQELSACGEFGIQGEDGHKVG